MGTPKDAETRGWSDGWGGGQTGTGHTHSEGEKAWNAGAPSQPLPLTASWGRQGPGPWSGLFPESREGLGKSPHSGPAQTGNARQSPHPHPRAVGKLSLGFQHLQQLWLSLSGESRP